MLKAFKRTVGRIPDWRWLGTRAGDDYKWTTFADCVRTIESLAQGYVALNLVPAVQAEGRNWSFMGI